jgi:hypothetical protein
VVSLRQACKHRAASARNWETYRLLTRSLILVLVSQLHRIAHVGHADAERRCLAFSCVSISVTALGTTAGPNALPAIGNARCVVALLSGQVVRQGQRRVGRAQARYIAEGGRGRRRRGLQAVDVDLGIWSWRWWCCCRCRDVGVSCHGSGKGSRERDRGWPESRSEWSKVTIRYSLTTRLLRWEMVWTRLLYTAEMHCH